MRRRFTAWLGVVAFALQALWPLIVQARAPRAALTVSICSAEDHGRTLALPAAGAPAGQRSKACQLHCMLCAVGADRAAIAPAHPGAPRALIVPARSAALPAAHAFFSRPDSPARPRAPPALS